MTLSRTCSMLLLIIALTGLPGLVFAKLSLTPELQVLEEYDSNIFLDPDHEVDDFVTTVTPGIRLTTDNKSLQADLDYRLQFRLYQDATGQDQTALQDVQRLHGQATLFPEGDFSLGLIDDYAPVVIDERRPSSENNPVVNKTTRNLFEVNPRYRLRRFKRIEPGLSYRYRKVDYTGGEGDDSDSHRVDTDVLFRQSEHLRYTLRYGFEQFNSQTANDYDRHDLKLGLEAEPVPQLSLGAEAGPGWIERNHADDSSSLLVRSWLKLKVSPKATAKFDYSQDFVDSVDNGLVREQRAATGLSYAAGRFAGDVSVYASRSDYRDISREDRSAGGRLEMNLSLDRRYSLGSSGYLTWFGFEEVSGSVEDVIRTGANAWVSCRLRYLDLRAGYRYEENDSELDRNDYLSQVVYAEASLRY
jgi:hypothetical protein